MFVLKYLNITFTRIINNLNIPIFGKYLIAKIGKTLRNV